MQWQLDTNEINREASRIVQRLGREPIEVYRFLQERFTLVDVSTDCLFQFVFRSFYRLDNAGLTDGFKKRYFDLLQQNRGNRAPDIHGLTMDLHEFPTLRDLKSLIIVCDETSQHNQSQNSGLRF